MHTWPEVDMVTLRKWRRDQILLYMETNSLDYLLLTGFDQIRYALDFRTQIIAEASDWFAAIVDRDGRADLFVPWVDEVAEDTLHSASAIKRIIPIPSWSPAGPHASYWVKSLSDSMAAGKRVGIDIIDLGIFFGLRSVLADTEFFPVSTGLYRLRQKKHPIEIQLLESASQVNAAAAQHALDHSEPGMTDYDVLALAMTFLQQEGVEFLSHSLCNHGRGTGTWFAQGSTLANGDQYFFDIGCYGRGGYASDIARTGFIGDPPAEAARAWKVLMDAYDAGREVAQPGVRVSLIHQTINDYLTSQGHASTPYAMGHGVGLRACELPTIHRPDRMSHDETLQADSVISLEPETALEIDGRLIVLKIEDNFVVENDGLRLLSAPTQDGARQ